MRIRSVKPDFWRDELTGQMPPELALFYLGMSCVCDDEGRFGWNPVLIASDLDPYGAKWGTAERVSELLEGLTKAGRLVRYHAGGKVYGWMPKFKNHQKPTRPTASRIPEPPEDSLRSHGILSEGSSPEMEMEEEMEMEPGERSATTESTGTSRGRVLPLPAKGGR